MLKQYEIENLRELADVEKVNLEETIKNCFETNPKDILIEEKQNEVQEYEFCITILGWSEDEDIEIIAVFKMDDDGLFQIDEVYYEYEDIG